MSYSLCAQNDRIDSKTGEKKTYPGSEVITGVNIDKPDDYVTINEKEFSEDPRSDEEIDQEFEELAKEISRGGWSDLEDW